MDDRPSRVLSVLLIGLPLSIMAVLLATIHAQYRLRETLHWVTSLVWVVSAVLVAAPPPAWVLSVRIADVIWSARTAIEACAPLLFVWVAWRAWSTGLPTCSCRTVRQDSQGNC
jgi:hypothetical protein